METYSKNCSIRLKKCREENNFTLEEIANRLSVNKSTVLRWEQGEVSKMKSPFLKELADLYNVNIVWLMGYDAPQEKSEKTMVIDITGLSYDDIKHIKREVAYLKTKNDKLKLE